MPSDRDDELLRAIAAAFARLDEAEKKRILDRLEEYKKKRDAEKKERGPEDDRSHS